MRVPNIFTAMEMKNYSTSRPKEEDGSGPWIPARAIAYPYGLIAGLRRRLKFAIGVFRGKYDVLDWEDR